MIGEIKMSEPKLRVENINKKYGKTIILEDISFDINPGEFVSILGSSGCGKTTLLKIIAGIETSDSGKILKDGEDITFSLPSNRGTGLVFQNYALFPNMNVRKNVSFALECRHLPKDEVAKRVADALRMVGMIDYASKKPGHLSGGQQQRVAIARTLAINADIMLFDEPMAALDAEIRMSLRNEIKRIQKETNKTMIYVTHDQEEAFSLSDRIIVLNDSQIAQFDTPKNIFCSPADEYVKRFVVDQLKDRAAVMLKETKQ